MTETKTRSLPEPIIFENEDEILDWMKKDWSGATLTGRKKDSNVGIRIYKDMVVFIIYDNYDTDDANYSYVYSPIGFIKNPDQVTKIDRITELTRQKKCEREIV